MDVSIIIKALNEEKDIANAIESSLKSIRGLKGEVILVDSVSTDKTIKIAKKYPIRIVQLADPKDKCCGVGPQVGYLESKGKYVYILDGDMELDKDFIKKGIEALKKNPDLAGVGGNITEMTDSNIVFRRRKEDQRTQIKNQEAVEKLMMGGLYKRDAISKVKYFSNPFLFAYEESDLGYRLGFAGYKLVRLPIPMIRHYGDSQSTLRIVWNRWKSRYLWGCGQYLRCHLRKPTFKNVLKELKIYLATIAWWVVVLSSVILYPTIPLLLKTQAVLTVLFLVGFFIKKRSISEFAFSLFSWNITALGLICGFVHGTKDTGTKIPIRRIQ